MWTGDASQTVSNMSDFSWSDGDSILADVLEVLERDYNSTTHSTRVVYTCDMCPTLQDITTSR